MIIRLWIIFSLVCLVPCFTQTTTLAVAVDVMITLSHLAIFLIFIRI